MKALLKKELIELFSFKYACYITICFVLVFSISIFGISLWGNGYTFNYLALPKVLSLVPFFLIVSISTFCSISFANDQQKYKLEKLLANPIHLYWSKFLPVFIFSCFILLSTLCYVFFEYWYRGFNHDFDISRIVLSYCSLLVIATVFIAICLTICLWVHRAWLVLVLGLLANSFFYFGGSFVECPIFLGYHNNDILKGLLTSQFIIIVVNYHFLAFLFVVIGLQFRRYRAYILYVFIYILVNTLFYFYPTKNINFSSDNKYSLNENAQKWKTE